MNTRLRDISKNILEVISLSYFLSKLFSGFSFLFFSITIYNELGAEPLGALSIGAIGYGLFTLPLVSIIETYQYHRQNSFFSLKKLKFIILIFTIGTAFFSIFFYNNFARNNDFIYFYALGVVINTWVFGLKLFDLLEYYNLSAKMIFIKAVIEYFLISLFHLKYIDDSVLVKYFIMTNLVGAVFFLVISFVDSIKLSGDDFPFFSDKYFAPLLIQKVLVFFFLNTPGLFLYAADGLGSLGLYDLVQRLFKRYSSLVSNMLVSFKGPIFRLMSSHSRRYYIELRIALCAMGLRLFFVIIFAPIIWLFLGEGHFLILSFSIAFVLEGYTQMRFFFHSNRPSLWVNVTLTATRMALTAVVCFTVFFLGLIREDIQLVGVFICSTAVLKVIEVLFLGKIGGSVRLKNETADLKIGNS